MWNSNRDLNWDAVSDFHFHFHLFPFIPRYKASQRITVCRWRVNPLTRVLPWKCLSKTQVAKISILLATTEKLIERASRWESGTVERFHTLIYSEGTKAEVFSICLWKWVFTESCCILINDLIIYVWAKKKLIRRFWAYALISLPSLKNALARHYYYSYSIMHN